MTSDDPRGPTERPVEYFKHVGAQLSRRSFLGDAAKVGGGAVALSSGSDVVAAGGDDHGGDDDGGGDGEPTDAVGDLDILNFALTLEKLEATFYEEALSSSGGVFDESQIENSEAAQQFANPSMRYGTFQRFETIRDHERTHVEALTAAIESAGGQPVSGLEFEFPYETVEEFVGLARVFEDTGASAYVGAAPLIENSDYLLAAAQILAIEARHASFIRVLNTQNPFPNAFEEALSIEEVQAAVAPFIVE